MKSKTLTQCHVMQDALFQGFQAAVDDPKLRAQLALAWDKLADRQRIIRGKPLPGSERPEMKTRTKRRSRRTSLAVDGVSYATTESDEPRFEPLGPPLPEPCPASAIANETAPTSDDDASPPMHPPPTLPHRI